MRGLLTTVETETKYSGYIQQQERQMERMKDCGAASDSGGFRLPGDSGTVARGAGQAGAGSARRHWARRLGFPE